ncbi:uncharacterized protein YjbI with pentapeptide repeats [Parabacteroides sp. PFB2-10]|uniref:pentapeptide repeat-containing protein n=1 Tax=Parabacteroides sp. PFB2-10 TaxID=1742405 RepID=UPI002476444A|nr:pentapeptide repeat-containing protein [Parabacteroides sp. PFB2-10]MDH6312875.1 uncharacterized protein YjbI with pentapeptide repeats [Parabacteroides sp. PFB2-10]
MKITEPQIADILKEEEELSDLLSLDREDIYAHLFRNQLLHEVQTSNRSIYACRLVNIRFMQCKLPKSQLSDIVFTHCDLSNLDLSGSSLHRVQFVGCKLLGTNFSETTLHQVLFKECIGNYMNFSGSKQRYVSYEASQLRGASFESCQLANVAFNSCRLIEAEFYNTSLKGMNLSDSEIAGLRINLLPRTELWGTKISSLQALDLIRLLGVEVVD